MNELSETRQLMELNLEYWDLLEKHGQSSCYLRETETERDKFLEFAHQCAEAEFEGLHGVDEMDRVHNYRLNVREVTAGDAKLRAVVAMAVNSFTTINATVDGVYEVAHAVQGDEWDIDTKAMVVRLAVEEMLRRGAREMGELERAPGTKDGQNMNESLIDYMGEHDCNMGDAMNALGLITRGELES